MIPIFKPYITGNEKKYLLECAETEWFSARGPFVNKFEKKLSKYIGIKYALSTSNCTVALHLALKALNIGIDDEVICPALTFISPIHMVKLAGAKPVLVDIEEDTCNMDPKKIKESITKNTKAIIVVHAFGQPAKMDEILTIAKANNLYVIEDVAEAFGATYKNNYVGSFGDISCLSFFANKMITTGEGGMVLTNNIDIFDKLVSLREYGRNKKERYLYDDIGFNYRMTNMQAALGIAQIENFDNILEIRQKQFSLYCKLPLSIKEIKIRPSHNWSKSVHWLMTIKLEKQNIRDHIIKIMRQKGIELRAMIYPVYYSKPYLSLGDIMTFPITEKVSINSLHLPSATSLTEEDIIFIIDSLKVTINEILKKGFEL